MAQRMPLPLTVYCSSKIQIGFTFLVPAHPGCSGKEAVKWLLCSAVYAVTMCPSVKPAFQQKGYMDRAQFLALIKRYIEQLSKHW